MPNSNRDYDIADDILQRLEPKFKEVRDDIKGVSEKLEGLQTNLKTELVAVRQELTAVNKHLGDRIDLTNDLLREILGMMAPLLATATPK